MLALQISSPAFMMGLGADAQPTAPPATQEDLEQQISDRIQNIRSKLITWGIPSVVVTGGAATLVFAAAFAAARTERVWLPSLILGGAVTAAAAIGLAATSASLNDYALSSSSTSTAPSTATISPAASTLPATTTPAAY